MAVTKILARKGRLDIGIDYILNGDKTEQKILTAHQGCEPGRECRQMLETKRDTENMGGVQYYHKLQHLVLPPPEQNATDLPNQGDYPGQGHCRQQQISDQIPQLLITMVPLMENSGDNQRIKQWNGQAKHRCQAEHNGEQDHYAPEHQVCHTLHSLSKLSKWYHIIPRDIYQRVQEEMARRTSKRKILQKSGKTEQGKYSAKYALSERLVCGECGSPYKRCTWARNGVKRIVWRCVSRLEFGKKYCHNSPSMAEDKLHTAILTVLNRVVEASDGLQDELAETLRMVCTPEGDGNNLMELERNMEALTTRQNTLLDQVLAHMDDLTLTEQLKALLEEKQHLQTRIDAAKKEAANRINEDSRMAELAAYLEEHLSGFQQYDDGIVRQLVERITVVDAETIRIKFRYSDVEIEQAMC